MLTTDYNGLFRHYYQDEYDFNTASLSNDEIVSIKTLVKEKRVEYAQAPMGTGIFDWITRREKNLRFETVKFNSDKIDGMLYIPAVGKDRAYIILNGNKPLINQIFTAAHEYYHYIEDYQMFRSSPYICDFGKLDSVNEKCASRFAAEMLITEDALRYEVDKFCRLADVSNIRNAGLAEYATLTIYLTVKYQMPLKAVIYRLFEENYIKDINGLIENYLFIKKILQEIDIYKDRVEELYKNDNVYINSDSLKYANMEKAFSKGLVSKETLISDAKTLKLDLNRINDIISSEEQPEENEISDDELFSLINSKMGG